MSRSIKGTETEKNLLKAFAGESQAKNRYTFFSKVARYDGYEQIAGIFMETAMQEETHAKRFFSFLEGGMVEITAAYPAGAILDTVANLKEAADGEYEEWHDLYPEFGRIADDEGFKDVAVAFKMITEVEKRHEDRYQRLLKNLKEGMVFEREGEVMWYCRKCGYIHVGKKALEKCPACLHPKAFFEIAPMNY
ncbi:MAG: rubrerythrin [Marinifilaceae bacterium]